MLPMLTDLTADALGVVNGFLNASEGSSLVQSCHHVYNESRIYRVLRLNR